MSGAEIEPTQSAPRRADADRSRHRLRTRAILMALTISAASVVVACGSDDAEADTERWLFVQTADTAQMLSDTTLVMPVEREIFGFTDRPDRDHAYLEAAEFVSLWDDDTDDGFADDPPNAVVTWNDGGELSEVELLLTDAVLSDDGAAITYTVTVEDGSAPAGSIGALSLFVDASMAVQTMQYQRKILRDP